MSLILTIIYIIVNIVTFYYYYRRSYGIFQTPCLFAIVSLTFVVPQLYSILSFVENPDQYMSLAVFVMLSCNIALILGFEWGRRYPIKRFEKKEFITSRLRFVIMLFAVIGIGATLMNRGVYKGGFMSGTFVIVNFFASYMDYLFVLILILFYKKKASPWFAYLLLAIIIILQLDKFFISARRGEAIQFVLALSFFYFYIRSETIYHRWKWVLPVFFIMGMFMNSQISQYRNNSYSGEVSVIDNINGLQAPVLAERKTIENLELNNAIRGINECCEKGIYDLGVANWNGLVKNFVPKLFGGSQFKQSLMFRDEHEAFVSYLSRSGGTMTGYYDAFTSFGLFAGVKFFLVGLFLGLLWRKIRFSIVALLIYVGTMSASLHTITHSTNNFPSNLFFFFVFIYPFIKYCTVNTLSEEKQEYNYI